MKFINTVSENFFLSSRDTFIDYTYIFISGFRSRNYYD